MNLSIENFGENSYTALKEDEKSVGDTCLINKQIYNPYSGSQIINNNKTLNDDISTKFFIFSLSLIGLFTFYKLLLK